MKKWEDAEFTELDFTSTEFGYWWNFDFNLGGLIRTVAEIFEAVTGGCNGGFIPTPNCGEQTKIS